MICLSSSIPVFTTLQIAALIERWNLTKTYSERPSSPEQGNCQTFVTEVLEELQIDKSIFHESSPLGEYIQTMRTKGVAKARVKITKTVQEAFGIRERKRKFNSHRELDEFVHMLEQIDPSWEDNHRYEGHRVLLVFCAC